MLLPILVLQPGDVICILFLMRKLYNIWLAIFAIGLFSHSLVQAQPLAENGVGVVLPAAEAKGHSTHPLSQSNLFNIYHPVESGISVSSIPLPLLSAEEREKSAGHKFMALAAENWTTVYLQIYHLVDRSPLLLKYIFPFHSFL